MTRRSVLPDYLPMASRPNALCMPILKSAVKLSVATLTTAWDEIWPGQAPPTNLTFKEDAFTFDLNGAQGGGTVMPLPIPNDELAGPSSTAWLWPGAAQALQGYGAHAIVFTSDDSSLKAFQTMTQMAAVVVRATDALGVYVGGAGSVVRADVFVGMAQELPVPVALWLGLRCITSGDGHAGLFTVGLSQFGLMEVEIPSSSQSCGDLRLWTMSLASWLIETQPTVNSGETVGLSAEEHVLVEFAPSMVKRDGPVWRLTGI